MTKAMTARYAHLMKELPGLVDAAAPPDFAMPDADFFVAPMACVSVSRCGEEQDGNGARCRTVYMADVPPLRASGTMSPPYFAVRLESGFPANARLSSPLTPRAGSALMGKAV